MLRDHRTGHQRRCLPLSHRFVNVSARHMVDVSFGPPGLPRTDILQRCTRCAKPNVKSVRGHWPLAEVL